MLSEPASKKRQGTNVGRLGAAASAFISKLHKLLIDGKWVAAQSGKTFKVLDPATGAQKPKWPRAARPTSILP